ncbi:MAG: exodeoxyribonuclease V subunit gamma [Bacteroidetes bacterium]|nr:exodeoxyribonuclease V subunit gamma [Bacteroidota bacterium]
MILTKSNHESINLANLIENYRLNEELNNILIIVPTNRRLRLLKKELVSNTKSKTATNLKIETLGTLSQKILSEVEDFFDLSESAATVLLKQSSEQTTLEYFSSYKSMPFGTLDRIKNVISEYKKHGITPDGLIKEISKADIKEQKKARDIAAIYSIYNTKCHALKAYELGDIYQRTGDIPSEKLKNFFNELYPDIKQVILTGFSEFTTPEIRIISNITDHCCKQLFIELDYSPNNNYIFGHLENCHDNLIRFGFKSIKDTEIPYNSNFINSVRSDLFTSRQSKFQSYFHDTINIIEAGSREYEIELIAKQIKRLLSENICMPSDICVGFNLVNNYSNLVKDKFESFGIPFNLTDRTKLENSNPVSLIVNLLEIVENNFYFKSVFRGISNNFLKWDEFNSSNLMKVGSDLKIISGYDNWKSLISSALKKHDSDEPLITGRKSLEKALDDITRLNKLIEPFKKELTIDDFLSQLNSLIINLELPGKILAIEGEAGEENVKGLTAFLETVTEIFNLIKKEEGNKKYKNSYFLDQIRTACQWARFNIKEKSSYGVLITSLDEMRGLKFKQVFIGGLCDGEFPTKYSPEIFFSGSFRKQERIHLCEERYRFYQALTSWTDKLYLSYPQSDAKKELNQSTFLKDFRKLFDVPVINENVFTDTLFSQEELLFTSGTNASANSLSKIESIVKRELGEFKVSLKQNLEKIKKENLESVFLGVLSGKDDNLESSYLLSENGRLTLNEYSEKVFSISQLEKYALCPFKYFSENVLKLISLEDPAEDIEALEMGNLIHAVLFRFSLWLKENNVILNNCDEKTTALAREELFGIANEELKKLNINETASFHEIEKLFGINDDENKSILSYYLQYEQENTTDFVPRFFEVSFGRNVDVFSDSQISTSEPIKIGRVKLQGKIDRIEISESMNQFNIVDYKTGSKVVTGGDIKRGLSLQLPVYLYCVNELLKKVSEKDLNPAGMYIYSLKFQAGTFGKKEVQLTRSKKADYDSINSELFDNLEEMITDLSESISTGVFPLSKLADRNTKVCGYCSLGSICRIREADQYSDLPEK